MKFTIDEEVTIRNELQLGELLVALLVKTGVNIPETIEKLQQRQVVVKDMFGDYKITQHWNEVIENVLLTSEKSIPKDEDLAPLAEQLMAIMPQCKKEGTAFYFKCNKREVILKLKKFFKLYGKYSNEDIIEATRRYVEGFNGNYSYMRILKYFILKEERKVREDDGKTIVEEVSELASMLENKDSSSITNDIGELL